MADANAEHADDKPNPDAEGGKDEDKTPEELTPEQTIADLTQKVETLTDEKGKLATKLGKQSGYVGQMKALASDLDDPDKKESTIQSLAEGCGLKVYFDKPPAIAADIEGMDPSEIGRTITNNVRKDIEPLVKEGKAALSVFEEQRLSGKYSNFDELGDDRDAIKLGHRSGKLSEVELHHLAAIGQHWLQNQGVVIAEAEERGKNKKLEELNRKVEEQISGGGTTSKDKGKGHTAESAADRLNRVTHGR